MLPCSVTNSSDPSSAESSITQSSEVLKQYQQVRSFTAELCEPLVTEDFVIQSMPDASPTKWHIAHTNWFFETFILSKLPGYEPYHPEFRYLFNSYYNTVGPQWTRAHRGMLSRPTVAEVFAYRQYVDDFMLKLLRSSDADDNGTALNLTRLGLHHEQQHQELLLMDIKHVFASNPLLPAYQDREWQPVANAGPIGRLRFEGGIHTIGHDGDGFAYDNEGPRHEVLVQPFRIASRLTTCGEYLEFIRDSGYQRHDLWLTDGWDRVRNEQWEAPLYWIPRNGSWEIMTLSGRRPLDPNEPVCHMSYYEADAYAKWTAHRLCTEQEWEIAAQRAPIEGNFVETGRLHPQSAKDDSAASSESSTGYPLQMFGDAWEWTRSAYAPYPGYRATEGALGEYNGKFMCNQFVLRGGACVTPKSHIRKTYRNFFAPHSRWMFSGIRLAQDA